MFPNWEVELQRLGRGFERLFETLVEVCKAYYQRVITVSRDCQKNVKVSPFDL
jgi:hypothetical protein